MGLKNRISEIISNSDLRKALDVLKNLAATAKESSQVLALKNQYNDLEAGRIKGTFFDSQAQVFQNRLLEAILKYVEQLPSEEKLLKKKLSYLLIKKEQVPVVLDILGHVLDSVKRTELSAFRYQQEEYEQFLSGEKEEQSLNEGQSNIEEIRRRIITELLAFVEKLVPFDLKEAWDEYFMQHLLEERGEFIIEERQTISLEDGFRFSVDILDNYPEGNIRSRLLSWQEEYLTGNYPAARKIIDEIRIDLNENTALVNEYSALSYLKQLGADKIIRPVVSSGSNNQSDFLKIMLFLERALRLGGACSSTRAESLFEIYQVLLLSLKKYFNNITHDYLTVRATPGRSGKREVIKKCFDQALLIHDKLSYIVDGRITFFDDILLELEGGGKYRWIGLKSGELINKTSYEALEIRRKVLAIINPNNRSDITESSANLLFIALTQKSRSLSLAKSLDKAKKMLALSCQIAYLFYQDERFLTLKKSIFISELPGFQDTGVMDKAEGHFSDEFDDEEAEFKEAMADVEFNNSGDQNQIQPHGSDEGGEDELKNEISSTKQPVGQVRNNPKFQDDRLLLLNWLIKPFSHFFGDVSKAPFKKAISFWFSTGFLGITMVLYSVFSGWIFAMTLLTVVLLWIFGIYSIGSRPWRNPGD